MVVLRIRGGVWRDAKLLSRVGEVADIEVEGGGLVGSRRGEPGVDLLVLVLSFVLVACCHGGDCHGLSWRVGGRGFGWAERGGP